MSADNASAVDRFKQGAGSSRGIQNDPLTKSGQRRGLQQDRAYKNEYGIFNN
jgi:hypothetical protein